MTQNSQQENWTRNGEGNFVDWLEYGAKRPDGTVELTLQGEKWHDLALSVRTQRIAEYQRLVARASGFKMVRRPVGSGAVPKWRNVMQRIEG